MALSIQESPSQTRHVRRGCPESPRTPPIPVRPPIIAHAFVQLRELLSTHRELAAKFTELERKLEGHDTAIANLLRQSASFWLRLIPLMTARLAFTVPTAEDPAPSPRQRSNGHEVSIWSEVAFRF